VALVPVLVLVPVLALVRHSRQKSIHTPTQSSMGLKETFS